MFWFSYPTRFSGYSNSNKLVSDFNPTFQVQFAVLNKVIVLIFTIKTAGSVALRNIP